MTHHLNDNPQACLIKNPGDETYAEACERLKCGELVAFPTETVYGLGADATREDAVVKIFQAKNRPRFNPLIIHTTQNSARTFGVFCELAQKLADLFWPGPLTIIVPLKHAHNLAPSVTAGLSCVGIRVPRHPVAQALLHAFDKPLAAPSANASGRLSPTQASHVIESLMSQAPLVIDGGPCAQGLESTIISCLGKEPIILRHGALAQEAIEQRLGRPLGNKHKPHSPHQKGHNMQEDITQQQPLSPGQLLRHYAPRSPLVPNALPADILAAQHDRNDMCWLGFGPEAPRGKNCLNLSFSNDLNEASHNFFAFLHQLDKMAQGNPIYVMPIPRQGLGIALNDRLTRGCYTAEPKDL